MLLSVFFFNTVSSADGGSAVAQAEVAQADGGSAVKTQDEPAAYPKQFENFAKCFEVAFSKAEEGKTFPAEADHSFWNCLALKKDKNAALNATITVAVLAALVLIVATALFIW